MTDAARPANQPAPPAAGAPGSAPAATEAPAPEPVDPIVARLREAFGDAVLRDEVIRGQLIVTVERERIVDVCTLLRDDPATRFEHLADVTAVDYLSYDPDGNRPDEGRTPRFDVVYHLYSISRNHRLRLKTRVDEDDATVPTVTGVWASANAAEREVFDLYGIVFQGHPNMTRILMPDDWQGHPLRKDYPLIEEEIEFTTTLERLNEARRRAR